MKQRRASWLCVQGDRATFPPCVRLLRPDGERALELLRVGPPR